MNWVSIDPASKSGIAYWSGHNLFSTSVLSKVGAKGKWRIGDFVYQSRFQAVESTLSDSQLVIIEEGFGAMKTAIKSQAGIRGYIEAVCDYRTVVKQFPTEFKVINVSEWRRCIKEQFGISWPATTEAKKALSIKLVKEHFGIDCTDDESDAVLIGYAAIKFGYVEA